MIYKKQKFRPGTLFYGKRGGICCCKQYDFIVVLPSKPRKKFKTEARIEEFKDQWDNLWR